MILPVNLMESIQLYRVSLGEAEEMLKAESAPAVNEYSIKLIDALVEADRVIDKLTRFIVDKVPEP